jgi:hypothetical protein
MRFLKLTQSAASCPAPEAAGFQASLPDRGEEGVQKTITATVGTTRVQATSHFSEADLRRILEHLVPMDLTTQSIKLSVPPGG